MLRAFVKFSLLTLGVDAKVSTCPGNLTLEQPMSLHSTEDRTSFLLQGRSTKVPPFGKGQGTLLVETGTMDTGLLDASFESWGVCGSTLVWENGNHCQ